MRENFLLIMGSNYRKIFLNISHNINYQFHNFNNYNGENMIDHCTLSVEKITQ